MPTVTIWHATWCAPCKGTIERVVPRLREEGVEPALVDVDLRPCAARDRHVDYLPTITVDDGGDELLRCRGHPTEEAIECIVGLCGQGSPGREAPPARPRRDDDKGTVTKAEPQGRDMRGDGAQLQDQAGARQGATQQGGGAQRQARYTDADVDAIISKKFAKWQEQHEAKVAEAAKLADMNETQRAEYERD